MTTVSESFETSVAVTGLPSHDECRAARDRVTESAGFRSAPRLAAFLSFVIEAALSGRSETLKAYTIAVGALGRSEDFNPATDAIVRVEAGRLRTALSRYYADEGTGDPIAITLPCGRYVPEFGWRVATEAVDAVVDLSAFRRVAHQNRALRAQHQQLRAVLKRNIEIFMANLRVLEKSVAAALSHSSPKDAPAGIGPAPGQRLPARRR